MLRYLSLIFATLALFACKAGPSTSESSTRSESESSNVVILPKPSTEEEVGNRPPNIGEELLANPGVHLTDEKSGVRFARPPAVRGLYVNAWAAG